jgi:hypothetical protein
LIRLQAWHAATKLAGAFLPLRARTSTARSAAESPRDDKEFLNTTAEEAEFSDPDLVRPVIQHCQPGLRTSPSVIYWTTAGVQASNRWRPKMENTRRSKRHFAVRSLLIYRTPTLQWARKAPHMSTSNVTSSPSSNKDRRRSKEHVVPGSA